MLSIAAGVASLEALFELLIAPKISREKRLNNTNLRAYVFIVIGHTFKGTPERGLGLQVLRAMPVDGFGAAGTAPSTSMTRRCSLVLNGVVRGKAEAAKHLSRPIVYGNA